MNIVITGASRGIGFELVGKYLDQGHRVFAIRRNVKSLNEAYDSVKGFYALSFDLSSGDFQHLGEEILKQFDEVDILINNAGLLVNKPFAEVSPSDLEKSYATNAFAPIYIVQTLSSIFNSNAHIINISSMGGFQGSLKFPGLMAYSSAKAALVCITECMQEEFKETNWAFNCLCLGAVQTEMLAEAFPGYEAPCSSKEMAAGS